MCALNPEPFAKVSDDELYASALVRNRKAANTDRQGDVGTDSSKRLSAVQHAYCLSKTQLFMSAWGCFYNKRACMQKLLQPWCPRLP